MMLRYIIIGQCGIGWMARTTNQQIIAIRIISLLQLFLTQD